MLRRATLVERAESAIEAEGKVKVPVVKVNPLEAVSRPAEVIVPVPVVAILPEEVTPVAPVIAPAAEILIVPDVRKLLNPVPKVRPLKALFAIVVTLPKLIPVIVLALALALVVPTRLRPSPLTVVAVTVVLVLVTVLVSPVAATPDEKPCVIVPVPVDKIRFWLAARVRPALAEISPEAEIVVKAPVPAVVEPIAPGAAKVAPFRRAAFRLVTTVVEATENGAVPVAKVEMSCLVVFKAPVLSK